MKEAGKPAQDAGIRRMAQRLSFACVAILIALGLFLATRANVMHVLLLQDYNTRLVVLATSLMGISSGMVGAFLLLRKRSLMGDALSHATLPGIALAFIILVALGSDGKHLGWLLAGASVTGLAGVALVMAMRRLPRIKDDTAMGIILSVFYGGGVALLGLIQDMPEGSAAGLESFIYGKTASLVLADFQLLGLIAVGVVILSILLFKELRLLCFDEAFAASMGWPVRLLDLILLALVCAVTVSGLQAVGLILIIAFLVIPSSAARMWTSRLNRMLVLSAIIGGLSGWVGATLSAILPRMPAGAVIVLVAASFFLVSLIFGTDRGILFRLMRHINLKRRMEKQHFLRASYELMESLEEGTTKRTCSWQDLLSKRSWSPRTLWRTAASAYAEGLVEEMDNHIVRFSEKGIAEAAKVTRNHRLWELYLIQYADIAPNHVDRDADSVEHVLGERLTSQLQASLASAIRKGDVVVPDSPHHI